jgi:hypothetical protein
MQMPKPGPEAKKLGYFAGSWNLEGDMKPGPMGPGGKMTGSENCSWFDGGFSVVCKSSGKSPMGVMKGLGILSYDAENKSYLYFGIDNMGMAESAVGHVENDVWTYTNESKMGGKTYKGRYTIGDVKPDSYSFKWELSEDGTTWMTMMEGKDTRQKTEKPAAKSEKKAEAAPAEKKS